MTALDAPLNPVAFDKSFDRVAALYDQARPSYPDAVVERILAYAALGPSARVLEVGTGTGKATEPFARRGLRILGLEPGLNLADIARARLAPFSNVTVETVSFEDWSAPVAEFDLAFVAQAFHWLAPEQRLPKFARVLRQPGTLAVFGNSACVTEGALHDAIQDVYQRHAPTLCGRDQARTVYNSPENPILAELRAKPGFGDAQCEFFTWGKVFSTFDYCALLGTYSDHSTLPGEQLSALLDAIARVIIGQGGSIPVTYKTGLFLARTTGG